MRRPPASRKEELIRKRREESEREFRERKLNVRDSVNKVTEEDIAQIVSLDGFRRKLPGQTVKLLGMEASA